MEGECVNSFTTMFLEMWNYINKDNAVHDEYLNPHNTFSQSEESGFVQPFCDSPLEHDDVGENLYVSIISRAKNIFIFYTISDTWNGAVTCYDIGSQVRC